jgi:hypothetical protein
MSVFSVHVLPIRAHILSSDSPPACAEVRPQVPIRRIATVIKHVLVIAFLHIFCLLKFIGFDLFYFSSVFKFVGRTEDEIRLRIPAANHNNGHKSNLNQPHSVTI